jgi:hypothetical protein
MRRTTLRPLPPSRGLFGTPGPFGPFGAASPGILRAQFRTLTMKFDRRIGVSHTRTRRVAPNLIRTARQR